MVDKGFNFPKTGKIVVGKWKKRENKEEQDTADRIMIQ